MFTFYVGSERKAFVVHSGAIAQTSPQLNALVNNGLSESQSGTAEFLDAKPDDFARSIEYAYRGDYTVPAGAPTHPARTPASALPIDAHVWRGEDNEGYESENMDTTELQNDPTYGYIARRFDKHNKRKVRSWKCGGPATPPRRSSLRDQFHSRTFLVENLPWTLMEKNFEPAGHNLPEIDLTYILLAHAWLYTFASMRFIEPLKQLTLQKLHRTLVTFATSEHTATGSVIELVRYAYGQGECRREDGTIEDLRKLLVEYTAGHVKIFGALTEFVELLQEGGEFAGDFWSMVYADSCGSW